MNELLLNILSVVITSIVMPLIIYLGKKLSAYLKTKTDNEKAQKLITDATNSVTLAVASTLQTYVDTLKKNGEFTKEAQNEAFKRAKETALKLIKDEAKNAITANFGDFNTWLVALIETKVKELK